MSQPIPPFYKHDCPKLVPYQLKPEVVAFGNRSIGPMLQRGFACGDNVPPVAPDLVTQFTYRAREFPSLDVPGLVSVKDYGAIGDSQHDDAPAIRAAIEAAVAGASTLQPRPSVLLPKGQFRLNSTVFVPPCCRLIGVGQPLSKIISGPEGLAAQDMSDPRLDPAFPPPLLQFEAGACAAMEGAQAGDELPMLGSVLYAVDLQTWDT